MWWVGLLVCSCWRRNYATSKATTSTLSSKDTPSLTRLNRTRPMLSWCHSGWMLWMRRGTDWQHSLVREKLHWLKFSMPALSSRTPWKLWSSGCHPLQMLLMHWQLRLLLNNVNNWRYFRLFCSFLYFLVSSVCVSEELYNPETLRTISS